MTFTDNVLTVFSTASDAHHLAGTSWYGEAQSLAREISPDDITMGAGIIAAHSINTGWNQNVRNARMTMATGVPAPGLTMIRNKAQRILDGEDIYTVLNGAKVCAFAATIIDPETDMVVIDRHARDIAFGGVTKGGIGKRIYAEVSEAYRNVAAAFNVPVSVVQAVTWVSWRSGRGLDWAG